jgi:hypothetical protein
MNVAGGTLPNSSVFQRSSASTPVTRFSTSDSFGW